MDLRAFSGSSVTERKLFSGITVRWPDARRVSDILHVSLIATKYSPSLAL
jgi:hypothetical protein